MRILLIIALVLSAASVDAKRRVYYRSYAKPAWSTAIREDDQARCQKKAEHMAKYRISGHPLSRVGRFEGTGYGRSEKPGTCTPYYRMTLTGDASAKSSSGSTYRVRSWR